MGRKVHRKPRLGYKEGPGHLLEVTGSFVHLVSLQGSGHEPGAVTAALTQPSPDGKSPDSLSGFQAPGASRAPVPRMGPRPCPGHRGTDRRGQDPGQSRAGPGEREECVRVAVAQGGEGRVGGSPRSLGDMKTALPRGEELVGCGWHLLVHVSLKVTGDGSGPSPPQPPTGTVPGPHLQAPSGPAGLLFLPLHSLPTLTHWGLEITHLYLCHHFHIICL